MTALAINHAAIRNADDDKREAALLAYLTNAQQIATSSLDATERYTVVRDVKALSAMAKAFKLSDEAARKLAETSILCLRLFGEALNEIYPKETAAMQAHLTGADTNTCRNARYVAFYTEEDLRSAFEYLRGEDKPACLKYVLETLRDHSPRVQRVRAKKHAKNAPIHTPAADPDQHNINAIREKVGTFDNACREILRLTRVIVELKKQLRK